MRTIYNSLLSAVVSNLNFCAFVVGFGVFAVSLAAYSVRLSGVVSGTIVMAIAAYPFVRKG